MNKRELVQHIAGETELTTVQVHKVVTSLIDITMRTLQAGDTLMLQGFGTFRPLFQTERPGRNPKTGEPKQIRSRTSVKFKPGKGLLDILNSNKQ